MKINFHNYVFFREVFSDYCQPTNVLYIETGSHSSGSFINKYIQIHIPLPKVVPS